MKRSQCLTYWSILKHCVWLCQLFSATTLWPKSSSLVSSDHMALSLSSLVQVMCSIQQCIVVYSRWGRLLGVLFPHIFLYCELYMLHSVHLFVVQICPQCFGTPVFSWLFSHWLCACVYMTKQNMQNVWKHVYTLALAAARERSKILGSRPAQGAVMLTLHNIIKIDELYVFLSYKQYERNVIA